ncbi:TIGR02679 family protein [Nonomuraea sp. KC401]|uniref:TIGR02679 family protein n=1 Tax=unclassified Nonomuraea TaxID=2593643 RepID=UPI0010FEE3E5|nr:MULTISPECIES: TIGR02679 family protein [unclassified Nonomuraea]NBE96215.1 TIGR02679 family protein [Nonomuraea sp. K271]TLF66024.1 TIGR02679 family protein [Nonomuraea sp. KC401]
MTVPDRLRAPELRPVWLALHERLSSGRPVSRVRVTGLADGQQAAVADLLGLDRYPGASITIEVSRLAAALGGLDVRAVTEEIAGPLGDRRRRREERERERTALAAWFAAHPVVVAEPALLALPAARAGRDLMERALAVLAALPAAGRPLAAVAADVTGDPHALDDGTRLSSLVLKALSTLYDVPAPEGAQARRALWERAGVACDALSTTALVAGLRPDGEEPLARALRVWDGRASVITLAQLHDTQELWVRERVVWVVENPTVLALAEQRFGGDCPPMVCTSGWPNSAVIRLLRAFPRDVGLRYHGDFDGEGLRIAAYTMAKTGAEPWRMSADDYLRALAGRPPSGPSSGLWSGLLSGPTPGRVTDAPWDPGLAPALRSHGLAVPEELVAECLLADLAAAVSPRSGRSRRCR